MTAVVVLIRWPDNISVCRHLPSIWLALCLLLYLCFAVGGDLLHLQHGRNGFLQPIAQACHVTGTSNTVALTSGSLSGDSAEAHCSICQLQSALQACTWLPVTLCTAPIMASPCISVA